MKEMNLCNGCFYAGTVNGCKPECNCQNRTRQEDGQEIIPFDYQIDMEDSKATKTDYLKHRERRISKRKAKRKNNGMVAFVEAGYRRLPIMANNSELEKQERKCKNAEKKAKRNKQVSVVVSLPDSLEKIEMGRFWGQNIQKLASFFFDKANNLEMAAECEQAIAILEIAERYNGDVVALYRKENEICITIGFYTKEDLSNFKRMTEKAS